MTTLSNAINNLKSFPCSSCGVCCKRINKVVENIPKFSKHYNIEIKDLQFPYQYDINGKCEMLDKDNKCKVYSNRPNICNIDKFIEISKVNKIDFYKENIKSCNRLIEEDGLDSSYKIKIDEL